MARVGIFFLSPVDKRASCLTGPILYACSPNSHSLAWYILLSSQILITNASPSLSCVVKEEPILLQGGLVCTFLLLLDFAVQIQMSVWPGPMSGMFEAKEEQQSQLAANCTVFRNSFSVERSCSLFVDCGYRFAL